MNPLEIKRASENLLTIRWEDGSECSYSSTQLRRLCPCAFCKEKRGDTSHSDALGIKSGKASLLKVIDAQLDDEIRLEKVWGVGNYALGALWGDGHSDGIYTWNYLREIASTRA